jgi:NAD(P)-dependent dehydrogenase (short-subunit alcohol dehydrogenase family)
LAAEPKVIIVTGAARGLGRAICESLVADGARVVAVIRSTAAAHELSRALGTSGTVVVRDIAAPDAAQLAVEMALQEFSRVDGLVNNAGIIDPMDLFADADPEKWEQVLTINLIAASRFMRAFITATAGKGGGRIVNITSGAAHRALRGWSAYCTSKAALAMLTKCAQLEYAPQGISSFNLIPGLIDTDMQVNVRASGINEVSQLPKSALRPAVEPARATAYLLSGKADDLAGNDVDIRDAGFRARVGLPSL